MSKELDLLASGPQGDYQQWFDSLAKAHLEDHPPRTRAEEASETYAKVLRYIASLPWYRCLRIPSIVDLVIRRREIFDKASKKGSGSYLAYLELAAKGYDKCRLTKEEADALKGCLS